MIELQRSFNTFWIDVAIFAYHVWLYHRLGISKKTKPIEVVVSIFNFFLLRQMILWSLPHMSFNKENTDKTIMVITQVAIFYLFQEFYMYGIHRYCHYNKFLYKWVHKIHHDIEGECFSTAMYMSPLEMVIHIFPDLMIGPIIIHLFDGYIFKESFIIWTCLASFYFVWSHSGVKDSQYMPSVDHHLLHHKFYNCNYGSWLSDSLFGTIKYPKKKKKV